MDHSLSIILPVRNAEKQLECRVNELIESVAELTDDIEILIIDDGSKDNTEDVAVELCRTYPQIDFVRNSAPLGVAHAAQVGIGRTTGDVIFFHNIEMPVSDDAIRQLWSLRDDEELVIARSAGGNNTSVQVVVGSTMGKGTKLLRRKAVNELQSSRSPATIIDRITRTDLAATSRSAATLHYSTGITTPADR